MVNRLPDICGKSITHFDFDKITGNDFSRRDDHGLAAADDSGSRGGKRTERVHGLFGRVFLEETDDDVESDDEGDDTAFDPGFDAEGDGHG